MWCHRHSRGTRRAGRQAAHTPPVARAHARFPGWNAWQRARPESGRPPPAWRKESSSRRPLLPTGPAFPRHRRLRHRDGRRPPGGASIGRALLDGTAWHVPFSSLTAHSGGRWCVWRAVRTIIHLATYSFLLAPIRRSHRLQMRARRHHSRRPQAHVVPARCAARTAAFLFAGQAYFARQGHAVENRGALQRYQAARLLTLSGPGGTEPWSVATPHAQNGYLSHSSNTLLQHAIGARRFHMFTAVHAYALVWGLR